MEDHERVRRFEADELAALMNCPSHWGAMHRLAQQMGRHPSGLYTKRRELLDLREKRAASGAFLPDDGLPYCARMALLHASVS